MAAGTERTGGHPVEKSKRRRQYSRQQELQVQRHGSLNHPGMPGGVCKSGPLERRG